MMFLGNLTIDLLVTLLPKGAAVVAESAHNLYRQGRAYVCLMLLLCALDLRSLLHRFIFLSAQ